MKILTFLKVRVLPREYPGTHLRRRTTIPTPQEQDYLSGRCGKLHWQRENNNPISLVGDLPVSLCRFVYLQKALANHKLQGDLSLTWAYLFQHLTSFLIFFFRTDLYVFKSPSFATKFFTRGLYAAAC